MYCVHKHVIHQNYLYSLTAAGSNATPSYKLAFVMGCAYTSEVMSLIKIDVKILIEHRAF